MSSKKRYVTYNTDRPAITIQGAFYYTGEQEEFLKEFKAWLQSKEWSFMGVTNEITTVEANKELKEIMDQHKTEGKRIQKLEEL